MSTFTAPTQTPLPTVTLVLGGVERTLSFDFNALCEAEKLTGTNLLTALASQPNAFDLRALLWAALRANAPELSLDGAGALISGGTVGTVYKAILTAFFGLADDTQESAAA